MKCAICGRVTMKPAVLLGAEAIGPTCAKRAGLTAIKPRAGSRLVLPRHQRSATPDKGDTLDLFADLP